ncbi:MAG: hypothetical protein EOP42_29850, partial [Sphingobacteriaceae bacterium]
MSACLSKLLSWFFCGFCLFFLLVGFSADETISLQGTWRFKTDQQDAGVQQKWFNKTLDETIKLPGSMAENNKGDDITLKTKWTGSIY